MAPPLNESAPDNHTDSIWRDEVDSQIDSLSKVFDPTKLRQLFARYHENEAIRNAIDQDCIYHSEIQRRAARDRARSIRSDPRTTQSSSTQSEIRLQTEQPRSSDEPPRGGTSTTSRRNRNRVIEDEDDQDGDASGGGSGDGGGGDGDSNGNGNGNDQKAPTDEYQPRTPSGLPDAKRWDDTPFGRSRLVTGKIASILNDALQNTRFHVFTEPFDPTSEGVYSSFTPNPMDLETMSKKVKELKYDSVSDFMEDVYHIVDNCISFYGPDHEDSVIVKDLRSFFERELKEYELLD